MVKYNPGSRAQAVWGDFVLQSQLPFVTIKYFYYFQHYVKNEGGCFDIFPEITPYTDGEGWLLIIQSTTLRKLFWESIHIF